MFVWAGSMFWAPCVEDIQEVIPEAWNFRRKINITEKTRHLFRVKPQARTMTETGRPDWSEVNVSLTDPPASSAKP